MDNVDLRAASAIYGAANMCTDCSSGWPSGSKSGNQVPDPGSPNGFCAAHVDLEMYGADNTIACAANEGSKFLTCRSIIIMTMESRLSLFTWCGYCILDADTAIPCVATAISCADNAYHLCGQFIHVHVIIL